HWRDNRQMEGPRTYSFRPAGLARNPRRFRVLARRKTLLRSIPSNSVSWPRGTGRLDLATASRMQRPRSRLWMEGVSPAGRFGAGSVGCVWRNEPSISQEAVALVKTIRNVCLLTIQSIREARADRVRERWPRAGA